MFEFAKKFGDHLSVVVSRDENFEKFKKRKPVILENQRVEVVRALKNVDDAILGKKDDIFEIIFEISPDVIVLGYDQFLKNEEELRKKIFEKNLKIDIIRGEKFEFGISSVRKIIQKFKEQNF